MMLLSFLSYVDRNVLALLSPTILADNHLSAEDYGWVISAFSVAYLVGNPFWGKILDRFGVRVGVAIAAGLWTCASAAHALAAGMASFAIARAMLGFGEGATFPAGLRTATQTLEPGRVARGMALSYSGGSLGAILTPILVTPIAARWGYKAAFCFTGILGVAWLAVWARVSRRKELSVAAVAERPAPNLRDPSLWGFAAAYALGGLPIGFVLYVAPLHLSRELGCTQETIGHVLWLPPLGWEVGYFFWGWLLDRSARRDDSARMRARMLAVLALLALPLALTPRTQSLAVVLELLFLGMFVAGGFVMVATSEALHRHSAAHSAYLAGLGAGSWSGVMALAMPWFGRLVDERRYGAAYAMATAAPVAGWLLWRALSRRRPLPDPPPALG
jgi:ACS family hexuronate transporter-like MFS transporter